MQKRARYIIPSINGHIDQTEMTDRGIRYIGRDTAGNDISVGIYDFRIDVNVGGKIILVEGEYLKRDDNDRKYVVCDRKSGIFMSFSVKDDDTFTLKYGQEG